jgi:multicomponent Na+:H+ antiporter subunit D
MHPLENNLFLLGVVFLPLLGGFISLAFSQYNRVQRGIALVVTAAAWACSVALLLENWAISLNNEVVGATAEYAVQVYRLGNWAPPYGIVLVADMMSSIFGVMVTTVMFGGMLYTFFSKEKSVKKPIFMPGFLIMSTGLYGAFFTGDIFTLFVFIEVMVIASVVLVTISDDEYGLEAAMKYLLISAMGSLFLLIGIAAIYASFGTLNMADIAQLLQTGNRPALAPAAAVMLTAAFLLKSAVFPFHFWQPDFHTTAPTAISAMLSSVVVKVGVYGIIRLVTLLYIEDADLIGDILVVLGIIGIFFGSLSALKTHNAKRMLAYSTFGQIGFILVGIGWGTPVALAGAIIYAVNHAFIKSSLLMLSGVVISQTKEKTGALKNLVGVGKRLPFTALLYFLGGLSLSGIPPFNGFISKLTLVQGGVDAQAWVALGLVVGGGLLTLLYMTRAYTLMFQQETNKDTAKLKPLGEGDPPYAPALLIFFCVVLGLYARPLIDVVQIAVEQIGDPTQYILAVLGGV